MSFNFDALDDASLRGVSFVAFDALYASWRIYANYYVHYPRGDHFRVKYLLRDELDRPVLNRGRTISLLREAESLLWKHGLSDSADLLGKIGESLSSFSVPVSASGNHALNAVSSLLMDFLPEENPKKRDLSLNRQFGNWEIVSRISSSVMDEMKSSPEFLKMVENVSRFSRIVVKNFSSQYPRDPVCDEQARVYPAFEEWHLHRLADLHLKYLDGLFKRCPGGTTGMYKDRLKLICLMQGGAEHFLRGSHGIKDLDVFGFFESLPDPHRKKRIGRGCRTCVDFGESSFGRHPKDPPHFLGRHVDILNKNFVVENGEDPAESLVRWLKSGGMFSSAWFLHYRPAICLWPKNRCGEILWDPLS